MTSDSQNGPELLDTCVCARYLLRDTPELTARAAALIDSDRPLRVTLANLAELGYLLTRLYRIDRTRVVSALEGLLTRQNIEAHEINTALAVDALHLCAPSGRVSFADAMLWAAAHAAGGATVWTFDRAFPSDGIGRREP